MSRSVGMPLLAESSDLHHTCISKSKKINITYVRHLHSTSDEVCMLQLFKLFNVFTSCAAWPYKYPYIMLVMVCI